MAIATPITMPMGHKELTRRAMLRGFRCRGRRLGCRTPLCRKDFRMTDLPRLRRTRTTLTITAPTPS